MSGWQTEGSQVYGPFQPGPSQGEAKYIADAVRAAHDAVYGAPQVPPGWTPPAVPPGRTPQVPGTAVVGRSIAPRGVEDPAQGYRAIQAASSQKSVVGVQGSAQVDQTLHLDVSVPAWLEAKLEQLTNFNFSVPMAPDRANG